MPKEETIKDIVERALADTKAAERQMLLVSALICGAMLALTIYAIIKQETDMMNDKCCCDKCDCKQSSWQKSAHSKLRTHVDVERSTDCYNRIDFPALLNLFTGSQWQIESQCRVTSPGQFSISLNKQLQRYLWLDQFCPPSFSGLPSDTVVS